MKISVKGTLFLLLLLVATHIRPVLAQQLEPIRIGSILILSGEGAATGTASRRGIELAVETLNASGGVLGRPIEVLFQDDQGDPKKTISAFRQLVDVEGINLLIGLTWSNQGEVVADLAKRKKVLTISPSLGVASFNESSEYLFNTWPHDFILSQALAELVYSQGLRDVALVGAEHIWVIEQTEAFKQRFIELGGNIVYETAPLPGTTELRAEALRIKSLPKVDAFVSTTDGVIVGSLVAKELKTLGSKLPTFSITLDQHSIDAAQGGFEGLVFLTSLTPTREFEIEYEKRFATKIDIGADSAYDALMLLANAIKSSKSTNPSVLAKELAKVEHYDGASGFLTADGKGGFTKEFATRVVRDGKPTRVD